MTDKELLDSYIKEIFGDTKPIKEFTLQELINSHRSLRALNKKTNEEWNAEYRKGYELGLKQGLESIKDTHIEKQKLLEFLGVDEG